MVEPLAALSGLDFIEARLTEELAEPLWLVVMLHSHAESIEKHKDDDEPIKPLLFDSASYPKPVGRRKKDMT